MNGFEESWPTALRALQQSATLESHELIEKLEASVPELLFLALPPQAAQVEGLLEGLPFTVTKGAKQLILSIGQNPVSAPLYEAHLSYSSTTFPSLEEFVALFPTLLKRITVAPFTYEFLGENVFAAPTKDGVFKIVRGKGHFIYRSRGQSAPEAYEKIAHVDPSLEALGMSAELQRELFARQKVDPNPLNEDKRAFPVYAPSFLIL